MKVLVIMKKTENLAVKEKLAELMKEARNKNNAPISDMEIMAVLGWYNSTADGLRKPMLIDEVHEIMYEISADEHPPNKHEKALA